MDARHGVVEHEGTVFYVVLSDETRQLRRRNDAVWSCPVRSM
jgi:hypothetical protein